MNIDPLEVLGYVAATLTTAAFVPQALQTFRTRNVEGISLGMYRMSTLGITLWLLYGLAIGSTPLIVANAITLMLASSILIMALRSRRSDQRPDPRSLEQHGEAVTAPGTVTPTTHRTHCPSPELERSSPDVEGSSAAVLPATR